MKSFSVNTLLSLAIGFSILNAHARAEQSESVNVAGSGVTNEPIYQETARDGELGESVAKQLKIENDGKSPEWLADVSSRIQLHGYAQGWYYYQHAGSKNTNTFLCKRTLLWANAQINERWSFLFMHDFNSVVQEYYTDFRITKKNGLTIRFGQFKNALSYENQLSPTAMETVDVYSEGVTYLTGCGSDPLNGVQYGRDQGISLFGETNNKKFRYELQIVNGQGINVKDRNNQKDLIARLEFRPVKGLNLCATGQIGKGNALTGSVLNPNIFNPTIMANDDYKRNRWTAGFDYKSRPFNVHSEYLWGQDGSVHSRGAYITGSIAIVPQKWDIIGSYDYFNFNTSLNQDMHKAVVGFQYWFFKKCRFQAQYVYKNAYTNYSSFFEHRANHQLICQMQLRFN